MPDTEGRVRAYGLVRYYTDVVGADKAFVVLRDLRQGSVHEGVVTPRQLLRFLEGEFTKSRVRKRGKSPKVARGQREVFAAMPFSAEYNDVYFVAMAQACERANLTCKRVDTDDFEGALAERLCVQPRLCARIEPEQLLASGLGQHLSQSVLGSSR